MPMNREERLDVDYRKSKMQIGLKRLQHHLRLANAELSRAEIEFDLLKEVIYPVRKARPPFATE